MVFLLTGGTAAVVNFASRILYNTALDFSTSVILAYITGMVTAYVLAKLYVFKDSKQPVHHSVIFFILINAIAILQTWVVSMALAYYLLPWLNVKTYVHEISHAVGVAVPVFTSYIGHKRWSFR
jgi:putative flippase GtrA